MNYHEIITTAPGKMRGEQCVRGLPILVSDVLDYLASGMTDEVLVYFPDLNRDDIRTCLAYAANQDHALSSERLTRVNLADRLMKIGAETAQLPVLDERTPEEILGFGDSGELW